MDAFCPGHHVERSPARGEEIVRLRQSPAPLSLDHDLGSCAADCDGAGTVFALAIRPVSMAISSFPIHSNILLLVDIHVAAATAFVLLLFLHVAWDLRRPGAGSLIRSRISDLAEVSSRMRGFIVGIRSMEKKEKYDALMKGFHTFLIVAAVGLAATGAVQFYVAPWWNYPQLFHTAIEPWWRPTWIHDALGFSLIALTVAHTYFALLRVNRPILRAMIIGEFRERPAESST